MFGVRLHPAMIDQLQESLFIATSAISQGEI
jgi:hypothetical protein